MTAQIIWNARPRFLAMQEKRKLRQAILRSIENHREPEPWHNIVWSIEAEDRSTVLGSSDDPKDAA